MKTKTVLSIIIIFSLASHLIAEDTTMITGREKREPAISVAPWDDWYALTLPGMDEVLVASTKFNFDIGGGKERKVEMDIYYPPDFNFKSKLPAVFICRGSPRWKSAISFGQLIAASGLIAIVPNVLMVENFGENINYILKNAKAFGINKKYIGIWGGGHPGGYAFDVALDKSQKYYKYIKCAVFEAAVLYHHEPYDKSNMNTDVPLLFITGSNDRMAKPTHSLFLEIANEMNIPLEYTVYEGASHNWYKDDTDEARGFIQKELDFLKSHLL
jgi:acetyl esterase/lipase